MKLPGDNTGEDVDGGAFNYTSKDIVYERNVTMH